MCVEIMINFVVVLKKSSLPLSILERLQHPASSVLIVPSASLRGRSNGSYGYRYGGCQNKSIFKVRFGQKEDIWSV